MTTVAEIIRDAFGHLRVLDANEAVEAEDATRAIRTLNLMMRRWRRTGSREGLVRGHQPRRPPASARRSGGSHWL
ncbi:hypothetical protein [Xylella fastidiosa]|uniref:hypothetical protein n=1 Tax=Xylella fastidiosa TaxID=2371 RepID=UPI003984C5F6